MSTSLQGQTIRLQTKSPEAESALRTGWLGDARVVARQLVTTGALDPDAELIFEQLDHSIKRPKGVGPWLQMVRAFSLTATATPCLAVCLLLFFLQTPVNLWLGLSALMGVLCLQIAINVFNDVGDYRRLIDLPGTLGGSGVIQNGWWTPQELQRTAWAALVLGIAFGLPAVLRAPAALLPIGVLGTLGTLLYSAKRFGLKYIALGDLAVFALCGPALTYGYAVAVGDASHPGVLWLGGFFGLLAVAILHVNNLQDIKLDRQRGIETLAIRIGFSASLRLLAGLYVAAALTLIGAVLRHNVPPGALLGLLPLVGIALPWIRSILGAIGPESALLAQCRIKAAQIHLASGLALILGLALSVTLGKFGS